MSWRIWLILAKNRATKGCETCPEFWLAKIRIFCTPFHGRSCERGEVCSSLSPSQWDDAKMMTLSDASMSALISIGNSCLTKPPTQTATLRILSIISLPLLDLFFSHFSSLLPSFRITSCSSTPVYLCSCVRMNNLKNLFQSK